MAGEHQEAADQLRQSIETLEVAIKPDHWIVAEARGHYGVVLADLSRFEEAETELLSSDKALRETFGEDHPRTDRAVRRLVTLYETWGTEAQAALYRKRLEHD